MTKDKQILMRSAGVWGLAAAFMFGALPVMAQAQNAPRAAAETTSRRFDIPAQDLNQALLSFANTARLQLIYEADWVQGRRSAALRGDYTPSEALSVLLSGTGLNYSLSGDRVVISRAQAGQDTVSLGVIRVEGASDLGNAQSDEAGADTGYLQGEGIDIGVSVISRKAIEARQSGNGDVNQTLKILPHVYFSNDEGLANSDTIQDLRPSQISISGGMAYENSFIIDGIAANSRHDTITSNLNDFDRTMGASAETIWVDSSLVDSVTVHDSNVSARHGGFTGGVVEIDTRRPAREYGATIYRSCTSNDLVNFKIPSQTREALGGDIPAEPDYEKCRTSVSLDVPVTERLRVLIAGGQQKAEQTYYRTAAYGGTAYGLKSRSRNVLLKAEYDLSETLQLTAQYTYAPYEQQHARANAIDEPTLFSGGGRSGRIGLKGERGEARWNLNLSYIHSDTSRRSQPYNYTWPRTVIGTSYCSSANCIFGGFGDLDQTQTDVTLKGDWSQPLGIGTLSGGFSIAQVEVSKSRPVENATFSTATAAAGAIGADTVCAADDPACRPGEGFLTSKTVYPAYDLTVDVESYGLWAEYALSRGALDVRAGLRYDRESVLENDNFAPRFTASYAFPWATLTFGANRYYHQSFLGYAVQAASPQTIVYRRTGSLVNGQRIAGSWAYNSTGTGVGYDGVALKTPYSDELTLGVSRGLFGGQARAKIIYRDYADQITRSATQSTRTVTLANGTTRLQNVYVPENGGESHYEGLSLEWGRSFGNHSVTLSTNIAKTESNLGTNAYLSINEDPEADEYVYYNGQVMLLGEVTSENQRLDFAAPGLANADWSAHWLGGRLRTNVNVRWREAFDRIEDTGANTTVDGVAYDVYDVVRYGDNVSVNGGMDVEVIKRGQNTVSLEVRGTNLLDTLPKTNSVGSTSQPYRFGRSLWVGIKYRY
ncbi:MAG: TonB-dependent receptor [Asticcacaulis sp.]